MIIMVTQSPTWLDAQSGNYILNISVWTPLPGEFCGNALPIETSGDYIGTTVDKVNDYAPSESDCTGYSQAAGPDTAYAISLGENEYFYAEVTPDDSSDAAIYVVTDCNDIDTTCVAGSDSGNPENVLVGEPGDYFLIVDGYSSTVAYPYTLTVQFGSLEPMPNNDCTTATEIVIDELGENRASRRTNHQHHRLLHVRYWGLQCFDSG